MEVILIKKLATKFFFLALLIPLCLFTGGCQSLFIPLDTPIVIQDNNNPETIISKKQNKQTVTIQSYKNIVPGIVEDITYSGTSLILLNNEPLSPEKPDEATQLNLFNTETYQNFPLINSEKRQLSAHYDSYGTGIYYIQEGIDPLTNKSNNQLLWTDINKDITRIISLPEENVVKSFAIGESDKVIYANNRNEIIISDTLGNRLVYTTMRNFEILELAYVKSTHAIAFIALDPTKEASTNLYYTEFKENSEGLSTKLVEENVIDFGINPLNEQLVFVKNIGDNQSINTWGYTSTAAITTIATGSFASAQFTPTGEKIIYTQYSPGLAGQSQSIWIMEATGSNPLQLTAPLKLTSGIISHPFKSILYFSVQKNNSEINLSSDQLFASTYQVTYSIE